MTISGDPTHGGSHRPASASPDEPTVNVGPYGFLVVEVAEPKAPAQHVAKAHRMRDEPAATKMLVVFAFFGTFVGFLHDIAPCAQRFSDAGKPCFFSGRKTVHMVTDFVEHIDNAVDTLERVGDFSRRRKSVVVVIAKLPT